MFVIFFTTQNIFIVHTLVSKIIVVPQLTSLITLSPLWQLYIIFVSVFKTVKSMTQTLQTHHKELHNVSERHNNAPPLM